MIGVGRVGAAQTMKLQCLARSNGDPQELRCHRGTLAAYSNDGGYIGLVPPKLGHRLVGMMEAGNRYEAAVASTTPEAVRVVLRESYQHPSQRSKLSFLSFLSSSALEPVTAPLP